MTSHRWRRRPAVRMLAATAAAALAAQVPVSPADRAGWMPDMPWAQPDGAAGAVVDEVPDLSAAGEQSAKLAARHEVALEAAVLAQLDGRGESDFWVMLEERADLSAARDITNWAERGQYVYEQLVAAAHANQRELATRLSLAQVRFEQFWIANALLVRGGDHAVLDSVLRSPEVAEVVADELLPAPEPVRVEDKTSIAAVEWGIADIRADQVWSEVGAWGENIVVGSIDTGVQFDHPALVSQYRGWLGADQFDHNHQWFDPTGACPAPEPCDDHNHGTHVTGTMVGDDGDTNQIGVAPQARWIAAKGCRTSGCSLAHLLAAGQFMLAPTDLDGGNPQPALRPHVLNNSWGGSGGLDFYDQVVAAWSAAGIFPVFSNGNSGPRCGTAGSPADGPDAYAVGAHAAGGTIAPFSSRGPGRGDEIRPHLSAPGVLVRSSVVDGYGIASGTSMAAPHVAGTVALMWSAAPQEIGDTAATRAVLDGTAVDTADLSCGGTAAANNVYGQGRLDALAATRQVALESGITGLVVDQAGAPLAGVSVATAGADIRTDQQGRYTLRLVPGTYPVEFSRFGYLTQVVPDVVVTEDEFTPVDIVLEAAPGGTVTGTVADGVSGHPIPGVSVAVLDVPVPLAATTGGDGRFEIAGIPAGSYRLQAATPRPGQWTPGTVEVEVVADATVVADIGLELTGRVERVSISSDGGESNGWTGDAHNGVISADGRYVTFFSHATNLVDTRVSGVNSYLHDRHTGVTELVARGPGLPSTTGEGRYIVLGSQHHLTDETAPPQLPPVPHWLAVTGRTYLYDRPESGFELASLNSAGEALDSHYGSRPAVSADGRLVTFVSDSPHLVPADLPVCATSIFDLELQLCQQVAVHDRESGRTQLVSVSSDGQPGDHHSRNPAATPDGRYVAFVSHAGNLVAEQTNPGADVYLHDRQTGQTRWVSQDAPAGGWQTIGTLTISDDARYVAIEFGNIFDGALAAALIDTGTGQTTLLEVPTGGPVALALAGEPVISGDGRTVAFFHAALDDTFADIPTATGVFGFDTQTGQYEQLLRYDDFVFAPAVPTSVSADGRLVVVRSPSNTIMPGVGNGTSDLFVIDRDHDPTRPAARHVVWDLAVAPTTPEPGQPVQVTAKVTNVGDAAGDYDAMLLVDGVAEGPTRQRVPLAAGQTATVSLTLSRDSGGSYRVRLGQQEGEFRVQSGSLTGEVTDRNDGGPVDGARVTATSGATTRTTTTVSGGVYQLTDLQLGTWTVVVDADGYLPQTSQVTISGDGERVAVGTALRTGVATADRDTIQVTVRSGVVDQVGVTLTNTGTADLAWHAFGWAATASNAPAVLVYSSNNGNVMVEEALARLGLDYTIFRDVQPCEAGPVRRRDRLPDFVTALENGAWDLVIVDHSCSKPWPNLLTEAADALHQYVVAGGRLIMSSHEVSRDTGPALWQAMGVEQFTNFSPIRPPFQAFWWEQDHPLFNSPLPVPEFVADPSHLVSAREGYDTPAGYSLTPRPQVAGLVLGNQGRTLFRSFWDVPNQADLDGNGVADGVQLWINTIVQIGNLAVRPWLDTSAGGKLAPGRSHLIRLPIDATDLAPGSYTGSVELATGAGRTPLVTVPVEVTVLPGASCDRVLTGTQAGPLVVTGGTTCLAEGAQVLGPVSVRPGAGLFATGAAINGTLTASGATEVELRGSRLAGPVTITGVDGLLVLAGNEITGPVEITDNTADLHPTVVSGNHIGGWLACSGNQPPPHNNGIPNVVTAEATGQCADL